MRTVCQARGAPWRGLPRCVPFLSRARPDSTRRGGEPGRPAPGPTSRRSIWSALRWSHLTRSSSASLEAGYDRPRDDALDDLVWAGLRWLSASPLLPGSGEPVVPPARRRGRLRECLVAASGGWALFPGQSGSSWSGRSRQIPRARSGLLDDLQAVPVDVPESEHGWHARPPQHVVSIDAARPQCRVVRVCVC